ncbi:hypothetical protein Tsubulata_029895 [Turnera subulata]|uniref:Uncharacterized protein n=1 Tax=Turnera subulata TaxID=218843 RepID=A0A9Q0G1T9_9ROSI|nr:hypothetical protein Tsubulata_029895 [Turnera subulata]
MMMGSLSGETAKKKAMWLYPKVLGFNPSERWGHSACYSNGAVYVFGGCCGGMDFSDVLVLDLDTMLWNTLVTTGQGPGPRDSHSAVLVGQQMIVFGGTNGSKKVNDLHVLDLKTKEWMKPEYQGTPPSPRESHTATLVGDGKMMIFGGSGEGEGNYLSDLHVLDLKTMRWSSPETKGDVPVPRDSHGAVAIGNKLIVYGGDRGDRYHGGVDVLDTDSLTWTQYAHDIHPGRQGTQRPIIELKPMEVGSVQNLVGAEVRGKVDGVFDSGLLMTAAVNGKIFRGVLFAPAAGIVPRGAILAQSPSHPTIQAPIAQPFANSRHVEPLKPSHQPMPLSRPDSGHGFRPTQISRACPIIRAAPTKESKLPSDLQGVVLTLGGPGCGNVGQV